MINALRKTSKNFFIKVLLIGIAVAFVSFGVGDILKSTLDNKVVEFKYAESVSVSDFMKAKDLYMRQLHSMNDDSDTQGNDGQINRSLVDALIRERLIDQLVKEYDILVSSDAAKRHIESEKAFQNSDSVFDASLLERFIRYSNITKEDYIADLKKTIAHTAVIKTFSKIPVSKSMISTVGKYFFDERVMDVYMVDFSDQEASSKVIDEKDLLEFYERNHEAFRTNEVRSIRYVSLGGDLFVKDIQVSEDEVKNYYDNHKDEFNGFNRQSSEKIRRLLQDKKTIEGIESGINKIDDMVAGGEEIESIASIYGSEIVTLNNISSNYGGLPQEVIKTFFNLKEKDLSYTLKAGSTFIVGVVDQIRPSYVKTIEEAREELVKMYSLTKCKQDSVLILQKLSDAIVNNEKIIDKYVKDNKINKNSCNISRVKKRHVTLPDQMYEAVFRTNKITGVYQDDKRAYLAVVKEIRQVKPSDTEMEVLSADVKNHFSFNVSKEILRHMNLVNNTKVNLSLIEQNNPQ